MIIALESHLLVRTFFFLFHDARINFLSIAIEMNQNFVAANMPIENEAMADVVSSNVRKSYDFILY